VQAIRVPIQWNCLIRIAMLDLPFTASTPLNSLVNTDRADSGSSEFVRVCSSEIIATEF